MGEAASKALELYEDRRRRESLVTPSRGGPVIDPRGAAAQALAGFERGGRERNISSEQFAARYVGQEDIGGEATSAYERGMLGILGDTFEEQQAVFNVLNPDGELLQIPDTDITLYRRKPTERFRKIDKSFAQALAEGELGRELMASASGLAGREALNITGEAIGLGVAKRPGGGTLLRQLGRLAVGGAGGETAQQALQAVRGTQRETLGGQAGRVAQEAGFSVVGGTLGAGFGGGINLVRGRGMFRTTPEAKEAVKAAGRLGVEEPLPFQMIENPVLKLWGRQAQALVPSINRALRSQQEMLKKTFKGLYDKRERGAFVKRAGELVETSSRQLIDSLIYATRHRGKDLHKVTESMQDVITRWWDTSGKTVDRLYETARAIEEPTLNLGPTLKKANEISAGVKGVGRQPPTDAASLQTAIETPIVQVREIESSLAQEINKIQKLNPNLPVEEGFASPVDVLLEINHNLRDIAERGKLIGARQPQLQAKSLIKSINEVLDNPISGNIAAWKTARRAAKRRFDTREQAAVIDILNTDEPTKHVHKIIGPESFDSLVMLSRAGGKPLLNEARNAFSQTLVKDPWNLSKTLADYDEPTLRMLMPDKEMRRVVRGVGASFDTLSKSGLPNALERQTRVQGFVSQLIDRSDTAGIDALGQIMGRAGGKNSRFGSSLRAAIIDEFYRRATEVASTGPLRGMEKLTARGMNKTFDQFSETGLLQFLDIAEKKAMRNIEILQRAADVAGADAGTSLQAAEAVAGLRTASASAISTLIENMGMGRLMTNKYGRMLLAGGGKKEAMDTSTYKLLGAIALNVSTQIRGDTENREFNALSARRALPPSAGYVTTTAR